ncbi:MAG: LamG domain-containing protein, partial [Patescibacteria group bacterium]
GVYNTSSVAFNSTTKYRITYERFDKKSLTDTNFGYFKFTKDMANFFKNSGCESFSCMNEWRNTICYNIGGNQAPDDLDIGSNYVQSQKDCVAYVKSQVPTGYPDGYTVSDLFYKVGDWIDSNSLGALDFLGYTSYDNEANAFDTMQRAVAKFGGNKIQLDEMSLSGTWRESTETHLTADNNADYNYLLQRRVKYALSLGIRRIFRFEFVDAGESNGAKWGFGYGRNGNQFNFASFLPETLIKCVIDPTLNDKALNFRGGRNNLKIINTQPSITALNTGKITFQTWIKKSGDWANNPTILKKDGSFILRYEGNDLKLVYWKGGQTSVVSFNTQPTQFPYHFDKWRHLSFQIDSTGGKLFIDKVLVASNSTTGALDTSNNDLIIGGENNSTSENFIGLMDSLMINNDVVALTDSFIKTSSTALLINMNDPLKDESNYNSTIVYTSYSQINP